VEDYSHSGPLLREGFKNITPTPEQQARAAEIDPEMREKLLGSEPAYMVETLAHIRERWGSARGYMQWLGLSEETIGRVRARMAW
jgi:hypothetical protein